MIRHLDRARLLTWNEIAGLTQAALVLCQVAFGLRRHDFANLMSRLSLDQKMPPAEALLVDQESRRVRWAHRFVPLESNCLLDSVATAALVRRKGYSVPLVIGVQKAGETIQAHAWLGTPPPQEIGNFRPLLRVPRED
jgi:hypothetical protein